jgi:hypothetical protein
MILDRGGIICKLCEVDAINPGTLEFFEYTNYRNVRETQALTNVQQLWAENQEFRNDVKECKKRFLAYRKDSGIFSKASSVIKENYLQNIATSVALIKDQKRVAINEFKRIPSKRSFISKGGSFHRKLNQIRAIYVVYYSQLRDGLERCERAPKFPSRTTIYYRWKYNPTYFFRIRI